jgi:hypothetical protein
MARHPLFADSRTLRGVGEDKPASEPPALADRTSTLRGMGFTSATLRGLGSPAAKPPAAAPAPSECPCCRVKIDEVAPDLAACFGVALAVVGGAENARARVCTMHARLLRLLIDELKSGPKRVGGSWED